MVTFAGWKAAGLMVALAGLSACAAARSGHQGLMKGAAGPAVGGGGAEMCYRKMRGIVDGAENDLPAISASAAEAAKLFVDQDYAIGAAGDPALVHEMCGRCGGLMTMENLRVPPLKPWKGIVLYALRDGPGMAEEDAFFIHYFRAAGSRVILFGSQRLIKGVQDKGIAVDGAIVNHAPDEGGIVTIGGRAVAPLDQAADIAVMWAWTGEFVAGCTRLGKMPTMYKGFVFPGGHERAKAIGDAKFHPGKPAAVAALVLGRSYLDILRQTMGTFHAREMGHVEKAAGEAIAARDGHHGVYVFAESHVMVWQFDEPRDPGVFTKAGSWKSLRSDVKLERGDFLLALGYVNLFDSADWGFLAQKARATGVEIAWALGGYGAKPPAVGPGEIFIDEIWKADDAVVQVPGYDIKILPTSGFMQELIYQATCAEILMRRPDQGMVKK